MKINKMLTQYNFNAMTNKKNEYIVIHYVGAVSSAKNNAMYYAGNKLSASANYFVDENEIWQSVEDKDKAWHCGGGLQGNNGHKFYQKCTNSNSLGIEMCCKKASSGEWYFEADTVRNTAELVKDLMKKYNIPIERVIRHYDVTGKICPAPYVDEAAWAEFKNLLKEDKTVEEKIYNYVPEMPDWAQGAITKLWNGGFLKGDGEKLGLTYSEIRQYVVLVRILESAKLI